MNFLKLYINSDKQESNLDDTFNTKLVSDVFETFEQVSEVVEDYYFNNDIDLYEDDNDVLFILEELKNKLYFLLDGEELKITLDNETELKAVALSKDERIKYIEDNFDRFKDLYFDDEARYSIDLIKDSNDLDSYINDNIFNNISNDYSFKTNSNNFYDPDNVLNNKMLDIEYAHSLTLNLKDSLDVEEFRDVKYPFIINYDGSEEFNTVDIAEDVDDLETIKDIFKNDYRF